MCRGSPSLATHSAVVCVDRVVFCSTTSAPFFPLSLYISFSRPLGPFLFAAFSHTISLFSSSIHPLIAAIADAIDVAAHCHPHRNRISTRIAMNTHTRIPATTHTYIHKSTVRPLQRCGRTPVLSPLANHQSAIRNRRCHGHSMTDMGHRTNYWSWAVSRPAHIVRGNLTSAIGKTVAYRVPTIRACIHGMSLAIGRFDRNRCRHANTP